MNELQRFPVLRKRMDEVIGDFLREGLEPSEAMIGDIIDMEVCIMNWKSLRSLISFTLRVIFQLSFSIVYKEPKLIFSHVGWLGTFFNLEKWFLVFDWIVSFNCELNY